MEARPLHQLERRLLKALLGAGPLSLEEAAGKAGLEIDQCRRAVEWLREKGLLRADIEVERLVRLGPEGLRALRLGLPERRLAELVARGVCELRELRENFTSQEEFSAALGQARRLGWVAVKDGQVELTNAPRKTGLEELLRVVGEGEVRVADLPDRLAGALDTLLKRPGYLEVREVKRVRLELTPEGVSTAESIGEVEELDRLSPELLASGLWRGRRLRPLDVEAPAPTLYPGKKHPIQRFIDEVREIFAALGFEEVEGPIVQPCFWNFDALFIPQDHPAREMQDTFYLPGVQARPAEPWVKAVEAVHEDGGDTGSRGWRYEWSPEEARRVVLRTHTTAVTVRYLADHQPEEARVFSVGRVFRNEKVTYKNLVEFHQIEGIVVGHRVTLRDLMGLLTTFYRKLGLERVKFWPTYFPYTEPSLQSVVYYKELDRWVELCGMGIFRPEVTLPFGVRNPVLAWGGGLERLVMLRYGVEDVRKLYENRLNWLRGVALCR
jgi:phenylalanyl-tRNA synthetase alpha chain